MGKINQYQLLANDSKARTICIIGDFNLVEEAGISGMDE